MKLYNKNKIYMINRQTNFILNIHINKHNLLINY